MAKNEKRHKHRFKQNLVVKKTTMDWKIRWSNEKKKNKIPKCECVLDRWKETFVYITSKDTSSSEVLNFVFGGNVCV